jgi:hypothetical protein
MNLKVIGHSSDLNQVIMKLGMIFDEIVDGINIMYVFVFFKEWEEIRFFGEKMDLKSADEVFDKKSDLSILRDLPLISKIS